MPHAGRAALEPGPDWMRANLGIALAASGHAQQALAAFAQLDDSWATSPEMQRWRERAARFRHTRAVT